MIRRLFLILGRKSFVVNDCLKSGTHGDHHTLSLLPRKRPCRPLLQPLSDAACLQVFQFWLKSEKSMLNWVEIAWQTWPLQNIQFLCLETLLGCFSSRALMTSDFCKSTCLSVKSKSSQQVIWCRHHIDMQGWWETRDTAVQHNE